MPNYVVYGALGAGKSLVAVSRIRDYLGEGRPIATNLDLFPEHLPRGNIIRLPDRVDVESLRACGEVDNGGDESKNGLMVFDECALWLNARQWGEKARQALIDFLVHARKLGWDLMFIVQHPRMLDAQVRDALGEYFVKCRRMDRLRLPFLGRILEALTLFRYKGNMPRIHIGVVNYGQGADAQHAENWIYRGNDLFLAYSTKQRFTSDYQDGAFCLLKKPSKLSSVPLVKPKLPMVSLVMRLPPDRRVAFLRAHPAALCIS